MNKIGIVCEYNPFHNGHFYHISESRKRLGADSAVICVMSGNYVQRGDSAVFESYARAEAACRCGADLVLELPIPWCLSSAERYARGAVDILLACGCTHLSFGSECGDIAALSEIAGILLSDEFIYTTDTAVRKEKKLSYAAARQKVLYEFAGEKSNLISEPNNILAIEYIKALKIQNSKAVPFTVKRMGSMHDGKGTGEYRSASELRAMLERGECIKAFVPEEANRLYLREIADGRVKKKDIMELVLLSRLRAMKPEDYSKLPDPGGGAYQRLYKAVCEECTTEDISKAASSKIYTASRTRRMLYCAALGINEGLIPGSPPYARVLAMGERGKDVLKAIPADSKIKMLVRASDVRGSGKQAADIFETESRANDLYSLQFVTKCDKSVGRTWRKTPIIV